MMQIIQPRNLSALQRTIDSSIGIDYISEVPKVLGVFFFLINRYRVELESQCLRYPNLERTNRTPERAATNCWGRTTHLPHDRTSSCRPNERIEQASSTDRLTHRTWRTHDRSNKHEIKTRNEPTVSSEKLFLTGGRVRKKYPRSIETGLLLFSVSRANAETHRSQNHNPNFPQKKSSRCTSVYPRVLHTNFAIQKKKTRRGHQAPFR